MAIQTILSQDLDDRARRVTDSLDPAAWHRATEQVLACPDCHGRLSAETFPESLVCRSCRRTFPIQDGVLDCAGGEPIAQAGEIQGRDALAGACVGKPKQEVLNLIARHHCPPVMKARLAEFLAPFSHDDWILDMGVGYGWHWETHRDGPFVVGIDLSLASLRVAHFLVGGVHPRLILVRADAKRLPIRARAVAGVWSVQMLQHVPQASRAAVVAEVDRIVRDGGAVEIWNLNPAMILRGLYWFLRKNFVRHGLVGAMELHRLSSEEWRGVWAGFRPGLAQWTSLYSELFFHPDLHLTPRRYPLWLEQMIERYVPGVASGLARQAGLRFRSVQNRV
ncbi:MAG: methyltransferase domain-containing protein [Nitrospira sp.]|nr:methyltransferase domain-containing protein [Nitrospira sp.]